MDLCVIDDLIKIISDKSIEHQIRVEQQSYKNNKKSICSCTNHKLSIIDVLSTVNPLTKICLNFYSLLELFVKHWYPVYMDSGRSVLNTQFPQSR